MSFPGATVDFTLRRRNMIAPLRIRKLHLFLISPNISSTERAELLKRLPKKKHLRIGFVDLALTSEVESLIRSLESAGHAIESFIDHHLDDRRSELSQAVELLKKRTSGNVIVRKRKNALSCARIVPNGEWFDRNIDIGFCHHDPDGMLSAIAACFPDCASWYPEFRSDADFIDSGTRNGCFTLSDVGLFLLDAYANTVRSRSRDLQGYEKDIRRVFRMFLRYLRLHRLRNGQAKKSDKGLTRFIREVADARRKDEEFASVLASRTQILTGGVALCDCFTEFDHPKPFPAHHWKKRVLAARNGEPITIFCFITYGALGVQANVELDRSLLGQVDLRDHLPPGGMGHLPNRAYLRVRDLPLFLKNWKRFIESRDGSLRNGITVVDHSTFTFVKPRGFFVRLRILLKRVWKKI